MQKVYVSKYGELAVTIEPPVFEEINGARVMRKSGRIIKFSNGRYVSSDPKEIELLEKTSSFESDFFDLLKQRDEAKKAQDKVNSKAIGIIEGARKSSQQYKEEVRDGRTRK